MSGLKRKLFKQTSLVDIFQPKLKFSKADSSQLMDSTDDSCKERELTTTAAANQRSSDVDDSSAGSPRLFSDASHCSSTSSLASSMDDARFQPVFRKLGETTGLGSAIECLKRQPQCGAVLPFLKPHQNHTVLFKIPFQDGVRPMPFPASYKDAWDHHHVRLPCSPQSLYPVVNDRLGGQKELVSRWGIIETSLLSNINTSYDLQQAIMKYNTRYADRWDFSGLHSFLNNVADSAERVTFFQVTLPAMVVMALRLPELITHPIPLLKQQECTFITMSQEQIASLLANAFFCTFPRRNAYKPSAEYKSYPTINFNSLFSGGGRRSLVQASKLRSLIHYFHRVTSNPPIGTVTFERRVLNDNPSWDKCESLMSKLHVTSEGTIEDIGDGLLQVDFANKLVGGGVLGGGCVQEEIRFLICPELIISRLFTEGLADNECLIITGVERYSKYSGYADTFRWTGNYNDETQRDTWGRCFTEVLVIDALHFHRFPEQFKPGLIRRELNKAYCGFKSNTTSPAHLSAIATGNWGCGAFGGDLYLKGLIQLMAAAHTGRDVLYITFGNQKLCDDLAQVHQLLTDLQSTVGDIWAFIMEYRKYLMQNPGTRLTVCDFILQLNESDDQGQATHGKQACEKDAEDQVIEIGTLQSQSTKGYSLNTRH
ncbi:poly(ADP-ribose) glycohydrolase-like isoform X2 [Corticium candelabrum]|uniref:poly(ADP-ribose) glycohydrolase-like isoform X2 n=1 Tax=Corticium candelabrum TaxID=121492 RepID=UPI002E254B43|nr:poly(ADP-ribose) glycohydrolase-like isoform X2 [Corticium candelabrum]